MENLFIEKPVFEKLAKERLAQDSSQWVKQILTYFNNMFPELEKIPVRITFTQKDETRGYAIGALYLGVGVTVPFIIDDFVLNDLDVAVINKVIIPLTHDSVKVLFNGGSAFSRVVRSEDVDATTKLFSRTLHTPGEIDKYSHVNTLSSVTAEQIQNFKEKVAVFKTSFEDNGTWDIVEKIANIEADSSSVDEELAKKLLPRNIYTIEKTGNYEFTAFLGNANVDNRVEVKLNESDVKDAHSMLEKSASVREYQEFSLPSSIENRAPVVNFDGSETNLELLADINDNYNIKESSVSTKTTPTGKFSIVSPKKMPSTSTKAALVDPTTKDGSVKLAQAGDFGTFLTKKGATKPIFVEKISKYNGKVEIEGFDGLTLVKLAMWKGIDAPSYDEEKNTYFWPKDTNFCKLGNLKENFVEFPEESPSGDWVMNIDGHAYAFGGINFDKYAKLGHSLNDVSVADSKWYMVQMGVSPAEMEKVALKEGEKFYFSSNLSCPTSFNDYVESWNEKIAESLKNFNDSELDLIKEASAMEDGVTIDALLSLNFLNKENLAHFIEAIPAFEEVTSKLAQLLLNVRLGLSSIPEIAVKKAMESLTIVTTKLYELEILLKKGK